MMVHDNYHEICAESYYELGYKIGSLFSEQCVDAVREYKTFYPASQKIKHSLDKCLEISQQYFPCYIDELRGYADGAGVSIYDLWELNESDLFRSDLNRCTTVASAGGTLFAHNEDCDEDSFDYICILKKKIESLTVLELYYYNSSGGNAFSINSHGIIQAINTLHPRDIRTGIPRNIIARWMSEADNPRAYFDRMVGLKRASGFNHALLDVGGNIVNIETTAQKQHLTVPELPFVHTNHYIGELKSYECSRFLKSSSARYNFANKRIGGQMTVSEIRKLMCNTSKGKKNSIFNRSTIAGVIADLKKRSVYFWLLREQEKGWIRYDLDFLTPSALSDHM